MNHQTFVRRVRTRWGITQKELATLLGLSQSGTSRCESGEVAPDIETVMGLQVVFGRPTHALFPGLYRLVEEQVMRRATKLDRLWAKCRDDATELKRRLLAQMVARVRNGQNSA